MIKILVTTDFSKNYKVGVQYAVQLATQQKCELVFFNVYKVSIPSVWSILRKGEFEKEQEANIL